MKFIENFIIFVLILATAFLFFIASVCVYDLYVESNSDYYSVDCEFENVNKDTNLIYNTATKTMMRTTTYYANVIIDSEKEKIKITSKQYEILSTVNFKGDVKVLYGVYKDKHTIRGVKIIE